MPKPVCVACRCFYRPKTNGFAWIEGKPTHNRAERGNKEPQSWEPYKLWNSDLFECPECGHQLIAGHASTHVAEHFEEDFAMLVRSYGAELQVNDC